MNKKDILSIDLSIEWTPYGINTYNLFDFESADEQIMENIIEDTKKQVVYDDIEWNYRHKSYVQALAHNWVKLMRSNILDSVIEGVGLTGKAYSPREYNYYQDSCEVQWFINGDALRSYIKQHKAHYEEHKIKSASGFSWLGNENETMLWYYLQYVSAEKYYHDAYFQDQMEGVEAENFIDYKIVVDK